jgi:uncharacterized protein
VPWWGDVLVGLVLLTAALGCVLPVLPGGLLAFAAVGVWALVERSATGWLVLALAAALITAGQFAKYAWPGRRLTRQGVPAVSIIVGGIVGIVGFFVIPLVGLPIGFVGGIFGVELIRLRHPAPAWSSTVEALKATGLSMLIELASVLVVAAVWAAGVVAAA